VDVVRLERLLLENGFTFGVDGVTLMEFEFPLLIQKSAQKKSTTIRCITWTLVRDRRWRDSMLQLPLF
jgi:hypothetical protein